MNVLQIGWYSIYLPRRDGRLSWPRRLVIPRWFTCPQAVTHRSTNRAQRTVTSLIGSNALPLHHATLTMRGVLDGLTWDWTGVSWKPVYSGSLVRGPPRAPSASCIRVGGVKAKLLQRPLIVSWWLQLLIATRSVRFLWSLECLGMWVIYGEWRSHADNVRTQRASCMSGMKHTLRDSPGSCDTHTARH